MAAPSMLMMKAILPSALALTICSVVVQSSTMSWWAMSERRRPMSVMTSSHFQPPREWTMAVPSIMLSNTASRPLTASPS